LAALPNGATAPAAAPPEHCRRRGAPPSGQPVPDRSVQIMRQAPSARNGVAQAPAGTGGSGDGRAHWS